MTHFLAAEGGYQSFVFSSTEKVWLVVALVAAVFGLAVGLVLMRGVLRADTGTPKMREIAAAIQEGAVAFLRRQFRAIGIIVVPLAVLIFFTATKVASAPTAPSRCRSAPPAASGCCASWPGRRCRGPPASSG